MHEHVHAFVETSSGALDLEGPVYEFGFCPAAGEPDGRGLRDSFPETGYIGCELGEAAQIDRLASLDRLPFPNDAARTVVCVNTLGHVFEPRKVIEEMVRILKPGGVLLLCESAGSGGGETIDDYWRLTPHALERLLAPLEATLVGWQGGEPSPHTVYGLGCKGPVAGGFVRGVNRLINRLPARLQELAAGAGWRARMRQRLLGWMQGKARRRRERDFHQVQFAMHVPMTRPLAHQLLLGCQPEEPTGTRLDLSQ